MRTLEQEAKYQKGLKLRNEGATYIRIMIECDVGYGTVRCWFNPNYQARMIIRNKRRRQRKRDAKLIQAAQMG